MSAHPIVYVSEDSTVEIPEKFKDDPRYQKGAALELVPVPDSLSEPVEKHKGDWRRLGGILAGYPFDATEWKRQEREWELAHDERKFGTKRPEW
jgi:hypothetical protein